MPNSNFFKDWAIEDVGELSQYRPTFAHPREVVEHLQALARVLWPGLPKKFKATTWWPALCARAGVWPEKGLEDDLDTVDLMSIMMFIQSELTADDFYNVVGAMPPGRAEHSREQEEELAAMDARLARWEEDYV